MKLYDFDSLLNEVLRNRPELTRDQVMQEIQEKKRDIGGGFLTDQGALFLIAGELGIQLRHMTSTDLTLKDIYAGANDITIVARILAVYPISEYKRKDGTTGRYRRLSLFDGANVGRLTIWDDNQEALKLEGTPVDTPIRVSNGYVKPGLDGKPTLNLGRRGKIEVLDDEKLVSRLTPLSKLARKVGEVNEEESIPAAEGIVSSASRSSNFIRSDGSAGSLTQFELADDAGKKIRVVIWNPVAIEAKMGQKVLVTNLKVRKSLNGERELHGDSGSVVWTVAAVGPGGSARLAKINRIKDSTGPLSLEVMSLSNTSTRDVTMRDGPTMRKAELIVGDDTGEIAVVGWRDSADKLAGIEVGQKIRILGANKRVSKIGIVTLELENGSRIEKIQG